MWLTDIQIALDWIDRHCDKTNKCCITSIENNIIHWSDGSWNDIKACVDMAITEKENEI